jgi:hypothetical protein
MEPIKGKIYTLEHILLNMNLLDSPFLIFDYLSAVTFNIVTCIIQTSHLTNQELLDKKDFIASKWKYLYTTEEDCPFFQYSEKNILSLVNITKKDGDDYFVVPK